MRLIIVCYLAFQLSSFVVAEAEHAEARQDAQNLASAVVSGNYDSIWPLFRHTTDNSSRSRLIHALPSAGVEASVVLRRLERERNISARRALILSLGSYTDAHISAANRQQLITTLLRWYREDPDVGIHSAIDWLLRHSRQGDRARPLDWGQAAVLAEYDQLAARQPQGKRWFVTEEHHTMAVVRGPVAFRMGSPANEPGRVPASDSPDEPERRVRIPRSFAISTKEVTVAQFQRFLDANPAVKQRFAFPDNPDRMEEVLRRFSPDPDSPQIAVTWYEAAMYCNWVSKEEGLPPSEWVYPLTIQSGLKMPPGYLHRRGYRLPTEAEWEYAARAGTETARFFGSSEALLEQYAWYSKNPPRSRNDPIDPSDPQRTWPVGQLKPNDLGLFDVYGNVWEWVQDRLREPPASDRVVNDVEDQDLEVSDSQARVRRGGGFPYEAAMMRSAARGTRTAFPYLRRDNVGFRIARTY
jgi:formylglycine-generating enzyme required for sulfatase activity